MNPELRLSYADQALAQAVVVLATASHLACDRERVDVALDCLEKDGLIEAANATHPYLGPLVAAAQGMVAARRAGDRPRLQRGREDVARHVARFATWRLSGALEAHRRHQAEATADA